MEKITVLRKCCFPREARVLEQAMKLSSRRRKGKGGKGQGAKGSERGGKKYWATTPGAEDTAQEEDEERMSV